MRISICAIGVHLGVVAALLLAGCRTAHMPLPDPLETTQRFSVEGRQGLKIKEHLRFGPYEAHAIDRSWVKGRDLQILAFEGNKRKQRYTFALREGQAERWSVSCEAFLRRQAISTEIVEVEVTNRSSVACLLWSPEDPAETWHLELLESGERPLAGRLSRGDMALDISGTRALHKGLPTHATTGYHFLEEEHVIGAVEVINNGAVWLHSEAAPYLQSVLSATAAALLLLEDLRAHLPEDTV